MRYFLDTEFIEDGKTIDLISIGIVAEDGREYYAISTEFKARKASQWVKDNVLAHLPRKSVNPSDMSNSPREIEESRAWKNRQRIRDEVLAFVGDDPHPEFWAYYADYDWVALCQLFGTMMDLPSHFPMFCLDIKQQAYLAGIESLSDLVPQSDEHHALADAKWNAAAWIYLEGLR